MRVYATAMTPKESGNAISKLGRKGDPRMHRAVAARLASPDLPLLDALRQGGFEFPPASGEQDSTLVDSDGVTLGQRKNQLSRRLRLARKDCQNSEDHKHEKRASVTIVTSTGAPLQGAGLSQALKEGATKKRLRGTSFSDIDIEDDVDMADDMANIDRKAKYHPEFHPVRSACAVQLHVRHLLAYTLHIL